MILKSEGAIANKTLEEQKEYLQRGISNEIADLIQEVIDELSKIKTKENSHSGDRLTEIENQKNALIKKREELSRLNQSMNNNIEKNEENQIIDSDDISNDEEMKLKLNKKNKDTK